MTNFAGILSIFVLILASEASFIPSSRSNSEISPVITYGGGGWHRTLHSDQRNLSRKKDDDCTPVTECEICTGSERKKQPSCKKTGRVQRFECMQPDEYAEVVFRSCKRSKEDEGFLMMQLQIFCFLIGSIALVNVRKHKSSSSSLFDQRKTDKRLRRNSNLESEEGVEIEFSSMAGQQNTEMEPLRPINIV